MKLTVIIIDHCQYSWLQTVFTGGYSASLHLNPRINLRFTCSKNIGCIYLYSNQSIVHQTKIKKYSFPICIYIGPGAWCCIQQKSRFKNAVCRSRMNDNANILDFLKDGIGERTYWCANISLHTEYFNKCEKHKLTNVYNTSNNQNISLYRVYIYLYTRYNVGYM